MSITIRTQTRQTSTIGDPVPDQDWTITSDTGPLKPTTSVQAAIIPANQTVHPGDIVTLDGSKSTGTGTLIYTWAQLKGTTATLSPSSTSPTITFPASNNTNGGISIEHSLTFQLTVHDTTKASSSATAVVDIKPAATPPPIPPPSPPPPAPTPSPPPPSPTPSPPPVNIMGTVAVQNLSTDTTDAEIQTWINAVKIQCDRDVAPIWTNSVNFVFVPKGQKPPLADWYAVFSDTSDDPGALAYHESGPNGEPLIKVFTKTERQAGESPSIGFSHEILESIADADANTTLKGLDPSGRPCLMFQEICDPCESSFYQINGITLSDFVTPDWFNESPFSHDMDFLKIISNKFQLAQGGYEEVSYDNGTTWTQIDKFSQRKSLHENPGSRHTLYKKRPEERRKSTFEVDKSWDVRVKK